MILPSFYISIEDHAFYECTLFSQISIPSSVTFIGDYGFCECSSLINTSIPSSVNEVKVYAYICLLFFSKWNNNSFKSSSFKKYTLLKQINIPFAAIEIGDSTFQECTFLL